MVLVVGGGPAGAVAAYTAASSGVEVQLLEQGNPGRPKACSGGLFAIGERVVARFPVDLDACTLGWVSATEVRVNGAGWVQPHRPIRFVDRRAFDQALRDAAAAAGATVAYGVRVKGVESVDGRPRVLCRRAEGEQWQLEPDVVVGADGTEGPCGRFVAGSPHPVRVLAIEASCPLDAPGPSLIDWQPWGYRWCFRKEDVMGVGLGGLVATGRREMAAWLSELDVAPTEMLGHTLPGRLRRRLARDGVLLAGDAAGMVQPLLGEGLSGALRTGALAGAAAAAFVQRGEPLAAYERTVRRIWTREYGLAWVIAALRVTGWHKAFGRVLAWVSRHERLSRLLLRTFQ